MGDVTTSVMVADEHPIFLEAVGHALERRPGLHVEGLFGDGAQVLAAIRARRPAVAVIDQHLPSVSGLEILAALREESIPTRVLFVTREDSRGLVYEAMHLGAAGLLTKLATLEEICVAVDVVAGGGTVLGADAQQELVQELRARMAPGGAALTTRERQVLELTAAGLSGTQIAARLGVAPSTIKTHVKALFAKLEVNDRAAAVAEGMRRGLLQ